MQHKKFSQSTLKRLPGYLTYLWNMPEDESPYISATAIANALGRGDVQVRKDLAMVSSGGRPKVGYVRAELIEEIEQFLGYDRTHNAVLIGAGRLGLALLEHSGFAEYGVNIVAAFDANPTISETESGKPVLPMEELEKFCHSHMIGMGIITVPADQAQQVCNRLVECGIKAIWNFATIHLDVPKQILVQNENMAASLAVLSMHLRVQMKEKK